MRISIQLTESKPGQNVYFILKELNAKFTVLQRNFKKYQEMKLKQLHHFLFGEIHKSNMKLKQLHHFLFGEIHKSNMHLNI